MAANVDLSPELLLLRHKIDAALATTGLEAEERPFRPHITLSRKTRRQALPSLHMQWRADFFCLYQSFLEATGARHVELGRFDLRGK